nr:cytosolic phospholipase A2 epsilon-like [Dromaius novaehollandiae]
MAHLEESRVLFSCTRAVNILELTVCDEDTFTPNDQLLIVCFDVAKIQPGEKVHLNFALNPESRSFPFGSTVGCNKNRAFSQVRLLI